MARRPLVIVHLGAVRVQFFLPTPSIIEAMQVDLHPETMQGNDLAKKVDGASVIDRVGNIKANNVQVFFQSSVQVFFKIADQFLFFLFPYPHFPCLETAFAQFFIRILVLKKAVQVVRNG